MFNISNDNIVHATKQNEHLQQLEKVFDKIREKGLKLNFKKCEFGKVSIKADSILNVKQPSNTSKVRSFLSLVTYCGKFIPNFAAITKPLR